MSEGFVVTTSNIESIVRSIREQQGQLEHPIWDGFLIPRTIRGEIDRTKYKGRGRPRDTDYERIDTLSILRELSEAA